MTGLPQKLTSNDIDVYDIEPQFFEFAVAVLKAGGPTGNMTAVGRELRPDLKHPADWARRTWARDDVQRVYRVIQDRTEQTARLWSEKYAAGDERRHEVLCLYVNGHGDAKPRDRMEAIDRIDRREGRVTEDHSGQSGSVNLLVAYHAGARAIPADNGGGRLPGVCGELPVDTYEDAGIAEVQAVAAPDQAVDTAQGDTT